MLEEGGEVGGGELGGGGSGACSSVTGSSTFFSISPISAANNANSSSMITARPRGDGVEINDFRDFSSLTSEPSTS